MPALTETFYDVLDISPDASTAEVRTAYRRRLKESHPDLNDADDADEVTRRIIRARDVLTDETERARYDRLGHDAYVGEASTGVDDGDVSQAARAARRAGWADGDRADADTGADESAGTGGRRSARDRRRRERAASERVGTGRRDSSGTTATDRSRSSTAGDRSRTSTATDQSHTSTDADRTRTSADGGANGPGRYASSEGFSAASPTWTGDGGYNVRREVGRGLHPRRFFPIQQSLPLLGLTFLLYPVMVFSAVFPPFPVVVNLVVAVCIVLLVGYLQSVPEVGVAVFGVWSFVVPVAFLAAGVSLTSIVGLVAMTATVLPFGLSALTFAMVRP